MPSPSEEYDLFVRSNKLGITCSNYRCGYNGKVIVDSSYTLTGFAHFLQVMSENSLSFVEEEV